MSLPAMEPFAPSAPPSRDPSYRSFKSAWSKRREANLRFVDERLQQTAVKKIPDEGGRRGWLCVVGGFFSLFASFGFLSAIGLFQTYYSAHTLSSYSESEIAWIFAVQLCLMWLPGPLFGRVLDTFGPAPLLYPGAFLCVFSLCMTSLCTSYYQIFLAQGLGFGLGAGMTFTAALVCAGQWFVRRRGLAVGLVAVGSSVGGVVYPILFDRLMKLVGFNTAMRYTALMEGVLLAIGCLLIRARLPRKKWDSSTPWFDVKLFKEKPFAFLTAGTFLVMWGLWAPFDFLPQMAQHTGFGPTKALYLISVVNVTSILGRVVPNHIGDTFGMFNVFTVVSFFTGATVLGLWVPWNYFPHEAGILVFALVYGFVSGAVVSIVMPCVAKAGSIETLGRRFGTFQIIIGVACLTGLPIMGELLNVQHGDFLALQLFSGVSCLVGSGLIAMATYFLGNARLTRRI